MHLTHFAQISTYPKLAENYGLIFSKMSMAMGKIIALEGGDFKPKADIREEATSIATYGKCTNWCEKKEHLHIKIFPFRGSIGQPYTVDSSFGRKEVHYDKGSDKPYVKMDPVKKNTVKNERLKILSNLLINIIKDI